MESACSSDVLLHRMSVAGVRLYAQAELEASDQKARRRNPGPYSGQRAFGLVTNTVTLIYGERDAVLIDTFLSVQHSKEADRVARR